LAVSSTGWPKDARRFFAEPPLGAANPTARKDIWHLMEWLGMRCLAKKKHPIVAVFTPFVPV